MAAGDVRVEFVPGTVRCEAIPCRIGSGPASGRPVAGSLLQDALQNQDRYQHDEVDYERYKEDVHPADLRRLQAHRYRQTDLIIIPDHAWYVPFLS